MQKFKRLLASVITFITLLAVTPIATHAEWRQGNNGWWYSQGDSAYATGWTQIGDKWYYFDSNGYMKTGWLYDNGNWFYLYGDGTMAKNTTIDGCYLNSYGAWTTNVPTQTSSYNSGNTGGSTAITAGDNQSQTVYVSNNGIYHSSSNAHGMKHYTAMSLKEAQEKGYRACKICY